MLSPVAPAHGKGGVQDIVWGLARGLASRGHEVELITTARPGGGAPIETTPDAPRLRVHYLAGTTPMRAVGPWNALSRASVAALHAERPLEAIHSQSFCGVHLVDALPGVPVVASLHGTHVDEIRTSRRLLRENLATFALRDAARSVYVWSMMARRMKVEGARLPQCEAVIATSHEQHALLASEYQVPEARLHDVWNGIDTALFRPGEHDAGSRVTTRAALGAGEGPLVLAVARLYQDKGIQHLLRAWLEVRRRVPTARLAIVGDGAYRGTLEVLAHSLGIADSVRFVGALPLERLPACYPAADVFVNPTVRINGYDLTILQAMACERAVVVSNIGSVPTAVEDGVDGVLVPPGDPATLAGTIAGLLGDPARRATLGAAAAQTVRARFSLDAMVEGTLAVYECARQVRK